MGQGGQENCGLVYAQAMHTILRSAIQLSRMAVCNCLANAQGAPVSQMDIYRCLGIKACVWGHIDKIYDPCPLLPTLKWVLAYIRNESTASNTRSTTHAFLDDACGALDDSPRPRASAENNGLSKNRSSASFGQLSPPKSRSRASSGAQRTRGKCGSRYVEGCLDSLT